jgi:hypothetical protein
MLLSEKRCPVRIRDPSGLKVAITTSSPCPLGISGHLAACDDKDRQERELRERLDRYELANLTAGAQPQHRLPETHDQCDAGVRNRAKRWAEDLYILLAPRSYVV